MYLNNINYFQYIKPHILLDRLDFMRTNFNIHESDFLIFDALRQASQCVGRVIRSKLDYGLMIFADKRYNNVNKRNKLPPWIQKYLTESNLNLSTEAVLYTNLTLLTDNAQYSEMTVD